MRVFMRQRVSGKSPGESILDIDWSLAGFAMARFGRQKAGRFCQDWWSGRRAGGRRYSMSTSSQLLLTPGRIGRREGETETARNIAEPQENGTARKDAGIPTARSALKLATGAPALDLMSAELIFRASTRSHSESPLND
jgi:hypothetical protein